MDSFFSFVLVTQWELKIQNDIFEGEISNGVFEFQLNQNIIKIFLDDSVNEEVSMEWMTYGVSTYLFEHQILPATVSGDGT